MSAMQAWRFGPPRDPKAWIVRAARNRAIDLIRRERRGAALLPELALTRATVDTIDAALAPVADRANQLAMMFAVCDPALTPETHVTLILRWLCGLSPKEIGHAFLVDTQTIDRRLHRGKARLRELEQIVDVEHLSDVAQRQGSVLHALYLLFSEGYHGSNPSEPVRPFLCTDALRLTELLLDTSATTDRRVYALAALFCFNIARLCTRLDADGVTICLRSRIASGGTARSSRAGWPTSRHRPAARTCRGGTSRRESRANTQWRPPSERPTGARIVGLYDLLMAQRPVPIVALNRALAVAERDGVEEGRRELVAVAGDRKLGAVSLLLGGVGRPAATGRPPRRRAREL